MLIVYFYFQLVVLLVLFEIQVTHENYNALNGQHLRVIWPHWSGNPKGDVGRPVKGGVILDYLTARFHFTYEMVRVTETTLEPSVNGKGLFNYLLEGKCDFLVADVVPFSQRQKIVDLTWPYFFDMAAFLIPVADVNANISAVAKPFQWPVWLALTVSILVVIFTLNYLLYKLESKTEKNLSLYVLGSLLAQGSHFKFNRLGFRLVAGVWALATFVFVQAYTATLFLYIMAPTTSPLINSASDLADSPSDIKLIVKRGGTLEYFLRNSNDPFFKKLSTKIDTTYENQCSFDSECVRLITPTSKNVFVDAKTYQQDAIAKEFKRTGKCNIQLARDGFMPIFIAFALQKHSAYTATVSQGLLELQATGLIDYWDLWFRPAQRQCLENMKSNGFVNKSRDKPTALTLHNLTGAFVVLIVGLGLSFVAFIYEHLHSYATGY